MSNWNLRTVTFSHTRLPCVSGFANPPVVCSGMKFRLSPTYQTFGRDVQLASPSGRFEVWSPNSRRFAYYPGDPTDVYSVVEQECLKPEHRRYDNNGGRFDPAQSPQVFSPFRPWWPFIRRIEWVEQSYGKRVYPEYERLIDCWADENIKANEGYITEAYADKLRSRVRKLDSEYERLETAAKRHDTYWDDRPESPTAEDVIEAVRHSTFEECLNALTIVQFGIKERQAWVDLVELRERAPASVSECQSRMSSATTTCRDEFMGFWANGSGEEEVLWMTAIGVPTFVVHEYAPDELRLQRPTDCTHGSFWFSSETGVRLQREHCHSQKHVERLGMGFTLTRPSQPPSRRDCSTLSQRWNSFSKNNGSRHVSLSKADTIGLQNSTYTSVNSRPSAVANPAPRPSSSSIDAQYDKANWSMPELNAALSRVQVEQPAAPFKGKKDVPGVPPKSKFPIQPIEERKLDDEHCFWVVPPRVAHGSKNAQGWDTFVCEENEDIKDAGERIRYYDMCKVKGEDRPDANDEEEDRIRFFDRENKRELWVEQLADWPGLVGGNKGDVYGLPAPRGRYFISQRQNDEVRRSYWMYPTRAAKTVFAGVVHPVPDVKYLPKLGCCAVEPLGDDGSSDDGYPPPTVPQAPVVEADTVESGPEPAASSSMKEAAGPTVSATDVDERQGPSRADSISSTPHLSPSRTEPAFPTGNSSDATGPPTLSSDSVVEEVEHNMEIDLASKSPLYADMTMDDEVSLGGDEESDRETTGMDAVVNKVPEKVKWEAVTGLSPKKNKGKEVERAPTEADTSNPTSIIASPDIARVAVQPGQGAVADRKPPREPRKDRENAQRWPSTLGSSSGWRLGQSRMRSSPPRRSWGPRRTYVNSRGEARRSRSLERSRSPGQRLRRQLKRSISPRGSPRRRGRSPSPRQASGRRRSASPGRFNRDRSPAYRYRGQGDSDSVPTGHSNSRSRSPPRHPASRHKHVGQSPPARRLEERLTSTGGTLGPGQVIPPGALLAPPRPGERMVPLTEDAGLYVLGGGAGGVAYAYNAEWKSKRRSRRRHGETRVVASHSGNDALPPVLGPNGLPQPLNLMERLGSSSSLSERLQLNPVEEEEEAEQSRRKRPRRR